MFGLPQRKCNNKWNSRGHSPQNPFIRVGIVCLCVFVLPKKMEVQEVHRLTKNAVFQKGGAHQCFVGELWVDLLGCLLVRFFFSFACSLASLFCAVVFVSLLARTSVSPFPRSIVRSLGLACWIFSLCSFARSSAPFGTCPLRDRVCLCHRNEPPPLKRVSTPPLKRVFFEKK